MLSERSMISIRWLALASSLAFLAIMNVTETRWLLLLIAAGVLYNLMLASARSESFPEKLKTVSTRIDLIGLAALIYFTGGPASVFVAYLAVYLFLITLRLGVEAGVFFALLSCAGLSYYYVLDPTVAMQSAVLTRGVLFLVAPIGAYLLELRPAEPVSAPPEKTPSVIEEALVEEKVAEAIIEEKVEEKVAEAIIEEKAEEKVAETVIEEKAEEAEAQVAVVEPAKEEAVELAKETQEAAAAEPTTLELPAAPDSLAQEIGIAVDKAGVDAETAAALREKITELSILHEASKALGASLILEEVIDAVVDISSKGLMADIAGALIFDGKTGLMTIASLRGFNAEEREVINSTTFAPGEGLLGEIFLQKKTVNINDLSDERPGATPFNGRIKSFIAVPLSTDGYNIGVIFLGKFAEEPFSKAAEEFLETLAAQAAIAVENAKLYTQAQEMAIHDGLTGIYNYRYFMKSLDEEIKRAERYGRAVSLMMIDIDLFKHVNDTYGHQRGDDVIKGLTQTLVNSTRETDIVSRYGGEEFCVILPETELDDAVEVAEKLRISVAKASYAREKGQSVKVTISLGVAAYPVLASNQEELLRKADDALYSAKTKRNMVVSATSGDRLAR